MRVFLSIEIPQEVKEDLVRVRDVLKNELTNKNIRWEKPEKMHLTVLFIGNIEGEKITEPEKRVVTEEEKTTDLKKMIITEEEKIAELENVISTEAEQTKPFELGLKGISVFPNNQRPRVIMVDIKEPSSAYTRFQEALAEKLSSAGFSYASPKPPHITIARIQKGSIDLPHIEFSEELSFQVNSVALKESILRPTGAVHKIISICNFVAFHP